MNIINITADTRKKSTMLVPNVVQNDSLNVFVVKIQEDRQDIELEDGIAYTLTNEDGIIIKGDKTGPNEITFKDRKSTRLNSSHVAISYAVFCLKKKRI